MDNISNLTSARGISDAFNSHKDKINHKTVGSYMQYLCNTFAFYKVRRYDIKGKKYLSTTEKYYLSDHSFRYAKLGTKNMDYGRVLENNRQSTFFAFQQSDELRIENFSV